MLDLGPENSLSFIQFLKNGFIIFGVISSIFYPIIDAWIDRTKMHEYFEKTEIKWGKYNEYYKKYFQHFPGSNLI